jgi:autoinducer 2-degrading protein
MYTVTIRMRVLPDGVTAFLKAGLAVVGPSRAEPGCLFFDLLRSRDDPLAFTFYEAYVDEAAFRAHLQMPHVLAWQQAALPHIDRQTIAMPESIGIVDSGPSPP